MKEVGAISDLAPAYPTAGNALAPLKAKAEAQGSGDFSSLWSGQAASLARETDSASLTRKLAKEGAERLHALAALD
jgi:nitronate monooxygenase